MFQRAVALIVVLTAMPSFAADARPIVGAIRWDAWHGNQGVPGKAVQLSLRSEKWRYRLPFFTRIEANGDVTIDGTSQEVMDREIGFAAEAGLDYWAFLKYPAKDAMSLALQRYLSSSRRAEIRFCLITECVRWKNAEFVAETLALMKEKGYQTVLSNRPLLYLGFIKEEDLKAHWGGADGFRKTLDTFRASVREAGLGDPYIVIMDFSPVQGKKWVDALGADAISCYATQRGDSNGTYAALASQAEAFWDHCRGTGAPVVPIVMTGWDRRPRIEIPMPWETWQKAGAGIDKFYATATPAELAAHLGKAMEWINANPKHALARAAIVYAWNENDEGGWLVPTLNADSLPNNSRLEFIRAVLKPKN